jgi:hypothetical protein
MRPIVLALTLLLVSGCSPRYERSDDRFLKDCWAATAPSNATYQMRFEALVIVSQHGGIFARSRACPDHRMWFGQVEPKADQQLDPIWIAARKAEGLGLGIKGVAIVTPLERRHEHNLRVRILDLPELISMSGDETERFIREFNIG